MRSPIAELLSDLGSALRQLGARWYLFGAQAAILHGAARLTADVDATVELGGREIRTLLAELSAHGFTARSDDPESFAETTRVVPLVHQATGMPCDLVLAGPGLEPMFLNRAVSIGVEDVEVPVAAADDIVVMKILAGRPKDLEDATSVVAACGDSLDLTRARSTLTEIERALDRSDLTTTLEAIVARVRRG